VVENSLGFVFTCTWKAADLAERLHCETLAIGEDLGDARWPTCWTQRRQCLQDCCVPRNKRRVAGLSAASAQRRRLRRIAFAAAHPVAGERPSSQPRIDVTEQHEAEEAFALGTRQRELILESVATASTASTQRRLTSSTSRGAGLGYTPEELTGRDVHEISTSHADGTLIPAPAAICRA